MIRRAAAITAAVLAAAAVLATDAAAQHGDDHVDRVLIVSLPTVSWEDLDDIELPNLEGLLDESAIADLSTRSVVRRTTPGDGYTTLDAGTRARGANAVDGLAFDVGETYSGYPVAEVFGRRTGVEVDEGIVSLGLPQVVEENEDLPYDAEVGALGDALAENDFTRAVIANADGSEQELDVEFGRAAAGGLMDSRGVVPSGSVGADLLLEDPRAPFGQRLDPDAVMAVFEDVWRQDSVVLFEGSDIVRADAYRTRATTSQRERLRERALEQTDEILGRMLDEVDADRDAVVVVGPYHASTGVHLTLAAVRAPEVDPGLLRSAVTRRTGFVTLADVAPTVLDLVGIERPDHMEGRPFERTEAGGSAAERRELLVDANREALFRDDLITPVSTFFVLAQLALWSLAVLALRRAGEGLRQGIEVAALATLALPPVTFLAGVFDFSTVGAPAYWLFVVAASAVVGAVCHQFRRSDLVDPLIAVLGLIVLVLVVDIVLGGPLQLNTTFGYTPTIAGRFAGLGNLAFAQLASASVILAGLLAWRIAGRTGAWAGVA
ncbi:MAG TPA: hypothetical protein VD926_13680, partial [Acidimicrobiales bacterium]|nr:hypothetical protein [Acidimicrobiales bacterium]